jgi:uncharacterized membrane protein
MSTVLASRPVSPARLDWLRSELRVWEAEGLLHDGQARAILSVYHPSRRFSLTRLLLSLGAVFVGVGLIWLVAANLDHLAPTLRFGVVAAIWLGLLVGGELLHDRSAVPTPVTGAVRLLAALAFGATVFQAAQSLQVPAYEPILVGAWGLGALAHAYVVGAMGPLLVGIAACTGWYLWQVLWDSPSGLSGVLALAIGSVVALSLAAVHEQGLTRFAAPWRETGALLALSSLFVAALPFVDPGDFAWTPWLVGGLVLASVCAIAALTIAAGTSRLEPIGAVAVAGVSVALVLWEAGADASDRLTVEDWAHAAVSVVAYVALAVAVAALGVVQDSWRLTGLATAALVVFTTFQSFAVFARVIQGAWLFVLLGLVFLATGYLFDRARRGLAVTLEEEQR